MDISYGWSKLYTIFLVTSVPFSPSSLTIRTMTFPPCIAVHVDANNHKYIGLNPLFSSPMDLYSFGARNEKAYSDKIARSNSNKIPIKSFAAAVTKLTGPASPSHRGKSSQYTIKVLPSPSPHTKKIGKLDKTTCLGKKSCNEDKTTIKLGQMSFHPVESNISSQLPKHITIKVQILPWNEFYATSNLHSCTSNKVALKAANQALRRNPPPAGITLVPILPTRNSTCTERHSVLHLFSQLTSSSPNVVIGGIDPSLCRIARRLAQKHQKLLILWTCLQDTSANGYAKWTSNESQENIQFRTQNFNPFVMVTPTSRQIVESVRAFVQQMGWQQIAVVVIDSIYWKMLAHSIDEELRKNLVSSLHNLKKSPTPQDITRTIRSISSSVRGLLIVSPLISPILGEVLKVAEKEGIIGFSSIIIIDPFYERENVAASIGKILTNESNLTVFSESVYQLPQELSELPIELNRAIMLLVPVAASTTQNSTENWHFSQFDETANEEKHNENQSHTQEAHDVLSRLIYDSISLVSHILRKNVGRHHLQRKRRRKYATWQPYAKQSSFKIAQVSVENIFRFGRFYRSANSDTKLRRAPINRPKSTKLNGSEQKESGDYVTNDVTGDHPITERRLKHIIFEKFHNISANNFNRTSQSSNTASLLQFDRNKSTQFEARYGGSVVYTSGERHFQFLLLDFDPSSQLLIPVMRIEPPGHKGKKDNNDDVYVDNLADIDWAFGRAILPEPPCTFLGVPCENDLKQSIVYAILSALIIISSVMASCVTAVALRKWLRQKALSKGPYKILLNAGDIALASQHETIIPKGNSDLKGKPDILEGSHLAVPSQGQKLEKDLMEVNKCSLREADKIKAKYNGDFIHMRYFHCSGNFEVKNKTMTHLKLMHDLRHENVNGFLGLLCDQIRPGFVFEYGSRGSLEDIIKQRDIKLDWSFRLSLLSDLVRGMRYLHCSPLRVHSRLTSRNCIIDGRWVLKITDYGLASVYDVQNINQPYRTTKELLYKAPELLRDETLLVKGSQPGDVFAFAIIMQEVLIRGGPYCMVALTYAEILVRLKKPPPMIRPSVSKGAAPLDAINIMKQCWAELPEMRPDFNQINDLFKKLNEGRRLNIVDTMFQMLEKYSSNLEDLIKERTELLDIEKKKTEHLLNRMLPSSVANQLKLGTAVAPEEFDEVTIYFSDIVGFTTISAYSTPFEVVDLLNDLYTAFDATINHYNVYKVETIGDAYMVVGGVPKKIKDHAAQVATMALDLLHLSGKFRIRHLPNIPLMLRIGIHTGPCCAGVVGMTMPRYCLFGDTVNTASRMESSGSAWRIHVSETAVQKLKEVGGYNIEYRGRTLIKGKGLMPTFWILGKDDFRKELPAPPDIGQAHNLDEELLRLGRQHYKTRRDSMNEAALASIKSFNINLKQQQEFSMKSVSSSLHPVSLSIDINGDKDSNSIRDSQILEQNIKDDDIREDDKSQSGEIQLVQSSIDKNGENVKMESEITLVEEDNIIKSKMKQADSLVKVKKMSAETSVEAIIETGQLTTYHTATPPSKRKKSSEINAQHILSNLNDIRHTIDEMGKKVAMQGNTKKKSLRQTLRNIQSPDKVCYDCESQSIPLKSNNSFFKTREILQKHSKHKIKTPDLTKCRKVTLGNGMLKKDFFKIPIFHPDEILSKHDGSEAAPINLPMPEPNNYNSHIKLNSNFDQSYDNIANKYDTCSSQPSNRNAIEVCSERSCSSICNQHPSDNNSPSPAESTLI